MDLDKILVDVRGNSPEEEYEYLKRIISNMPFYLEHGYTVGLPDLDELKSEQVIKDEKRMYPIFLEKEYNKSYFAEGVKKIKEKLSVIENCLPKLAEPSKRWGFKLFDKYLVLLTKYGPGGSYDSQTGKITMLTRKDGTFKQEDPEQTVIHEIIHMGIEECVVGVFKLSHSEKERLVDLLVKKTFGDVFPNYKLQSMGETKIDPYITDESINNLPPDIKKYVSSYPRQ